MTRTGAREPSPGLDAGAATRREMLVRALKEASYEVIPLRSAEESVLAHVPMSVQLTVTVTASRGLEPTIGLVERLQGYGYSAAPHLAARIFRDDAHVTDVVQRLREAGVDSVFVIAGDAQEPVGSFPDALALLDRLHALGRPFRSIGIAGYPEGHASFGDRVMNEALQRKAPYATQVITQLCFDARTTTTWAAATAARGVRLPIRVGIPGPVGRGKLVRVCAGLGLGQSARFLRKQQNLFWRFLRPGGYSPNRLVEQLTPAFGAPDNALVGLHIFTFNELEKTQAWRNEWLQRLS